jgi:hypothetical protein
LDVGGLVVLGFWWGMREKMTHGGDFGLEELRLQKRVVAED